MNLEISKDKNYNLIIQNSVGKNFHQEEDFLICFIQIQHDVVCKCKSSCNLRIIL